MCMLLELVIIFSIFNILYWTGDDVEANADFSLSPIARIALPIYQFTIVKIKHWQCYEMTFVVQFDVKHSFVYIFGRRGERLAEKWGGDRLVDIQLKCCHDKIISNFHMKHVDCTTVHAAALLSAWHFIVPDYYRIESTCSRLHWIMAIQLHWILASRMDLVFLLITKQLVEFYDFYGLNCNCRGYKTKLKKKKMSASL